MKVISSYTAELILVGAGPGDPELITVKAWRVLQEADVFVDDLFCFADEAFRKPGPTAFQVFGDRYFVAELFEQEDGFDSCFYIVIVREFVAKKIDLFCDGGPARLPPAVAPPFP